MIFRQRILLTPSENDMDYRLDQPENASRQKRWKRKLLKEGKDFNASKNIY